MRAFEIHTFQGGKWKIDSVFDDRDLAVFEAQRMEGSKRYSGVRVVEENFDEQTHQTQTRTIYKGTVVDNQPGPEPPKKAVSGGAKGAKPAARGGAAPVRRGAKVAAEPKGQKSNTLLVALLGIIVVGGLAAVVALRFLSGH